MEDKNIISEETAAEQFDLFCDYYGVDLTELDDEGATGRKTSDIMRGKFMRAVREGSLEVVESGDGLTVVQNLRYPIGGKVDRLTYGELNGRARKSMKNIQSPHERIYALLGALSRESSSLFDAMRGKDLAVAEMIGGLFFAV